MVYSREQFLKDNPDKTIKIEEYVANSGYYCHKAKCTFKGDWEVQDLVNYVDDSTGNYGGRLENVRKNEDGSTTATVVVYFD